MIAILACQEPDPAPVPVASADTYPDPAFVWEAEGHADVVSDDTFAWERVTIWRDLTDVRAVYVGAETTWVGTGEGLYRVDGDVVTAVPLAVEGAVADVVETPDGVCAGVGHLLCQLSFGYLPHAKITASMRRLASQVMPRLR